MKARLEKLISKNAVGLWLFENVSMEIDWVYKPVQLEIERIERQQRFPDTPTLALESETVRAIAQEAIRMGLVEFSDGSGSELTATRYHLEDMRKLVFK